MTLDDSTSAVRGLAVLVTHTHFVVVVVGKIFQAKPEHPKKRKSIFPRYSRLPKFELQ
jgi:hypothetical protein